MIQKLVSIEKINLKDDRFRTGIIDENLSSLKNSIKEVGLIYPPILNKRGTDFLIVSGWKRILACIELGHKKIPAFILEEKNDLNIFLFKVWEDLSNKELNFLEKAEIISKLVSFGIKKEDIIEKYFPLLKIKQSFFDFEVYISISKLDISVKKAILKNKITFQVAKALSFFSKKEQKRILPFLLPLSSNYQKELLENIYEILKRDNISFESLLEGKNVMGIIHSDELSPLEKAKKFKEEIKKLRFPFYIREEERYENWIKRLKLPSEVKISRDKFFEEEKLALNIKFIGPKDLEEILINMLKICKSREFNKYFKREE